MLEARDPLIGRVVANKYRIESHIGAGGMGSVYRARHVETGGPVAIKVMIPDRQSRPTAIKRFALEAQNAAALRHAHAVRVLDFGTDDDVMFLAMEFLEGESLHAVLEREGRLPWKRAVAMVRQVLLALWEAHEHPRRIVHRDIKPANILVCDQVGHGDFLKVVDFGVARSLEGTGAGTHGAIGTPHAMAPEQWSGTSDARSDLYAVGCLIYELLSGRPPFVAPSNTSQSTLIVTIASMHLHSVPAPLTRSAPGVPVGLARLVHALLEKRPEQRPGSAREVIELCDRVLEGDALDELAAPFERALAARPPSGMAAASPPLLLGARAEAMADEETVDADGIIVPALRPAAPLPTAHGEQAPAGAFLAAPPAGIDASEVEAPRRAASRAVVVPPPRHSSSGAAPPMAAAPTPTPMPPAAVQSGPSPRPPSAVQSPSPRPPSAVQSPSPAAKSSDAVKPAPAPRRRGRGGWLVLLLLLGVATGAYGFRAGWFGGARGDVGAAVLPSPPTPPPRVEVAEPSAAAVAAGVQRKAPAVDAPPLPPPSTGRVAVAGAVDEARNGDDDNRPLLTFRAHLSAADRKSDRGAKLRRASEIIVQHRANVHSGRHRDPEDSVDSLYADAGERRRLRVLLDKALSKQARRAIEKGEVRVEVQVWRDYAMVSLLR
ncbi:MAG: hypothetical protein RIT45_1716 [Pseudomonadota bacterium]